MRSVKGGASYAAVLGLIDIKIDIKIDTKIDTKINTNVVPTWQHFAPRPTGPNTGLNLRNDTTGNVFGGQKAKRHRRTKIGTGARIAAAKYGRHIRAHRI